MWDAEESTGLTANLGNTNSATDTGTKCQYHCNTNYTWNAASSTCVANTFSCTGTTPANASMWDAEESTGLTANLGKTHSTTDTGTKCQYHCNTNYTWKAASST